MTEQEATVRMAAAIERIANTQEVFTGGDSVRVLERLIEAPYGVTPNEDVARLVLTMAQAIALAAAAQRSPYEFGIYPPVRVERKGLFS